MCDKKVKSREAVDPKYKWNLEAMYPDEQVWDQDYSEVLSMAEAFSKYRGTLGDCAAQLLSAMCDKDAMWLVAERVYVYARMRRDEDNRKARYQAMTDKCHSMLAKASAALSFFTPELLEIPEETLMGFIDSESGLSQYRFVIVETIRQKAHVLSRQEESLMAQMSEITGATGDIFTMLNNADIRFGTVTDEDGDAVELTHGTYVGFMESYHRPLRQEAFSHMYDAYQKQINTIASAYSYNTKTDVVTARIRKYESSLHAALSGDNIPISVYDNLIDTVNQNLNSVHRYMELRKRLLAVDSLHMYDIYVPLVELPKRDIPYEEALDMMRAGLAPLGKDYLRHMNDGLAAGWIDVYENEGKTSGAYSFGSYDSMPYILLNYTGKLKDTFTIVHEMGHSMHSWYTRNTQPFTYGGHSIFTAEVASTVNEALLMKHLLATEKDPSMRKYLLNMHIEEFRTTLFRQTMFAEFERLTHSASEQGESLTPEWLCEEYGKLNAKYYGNAVTEDPEIKYEWARIPHFYNAFYVYKYATGFSAAAAISDRILSGGNQAREDYISFLRSGESDHPIELLKIAGVDMGTPAPVKSAMHTFEKLVDEFEKLL